MIVGHKTLQEQLASSIEHEANSHAYVFVGSESVGKFDVAKEFAEQILSFDCKDIDRSNVLMDMMVIEPETETEKDIVKEKDISVERVREALRFLSLAPFVSKKKVLIVRDAHRLNESSQNALLKTLEEPPAYATIILTTHRFGDLLPTVVSRCRKVVFHDVSKEDMQKAAQEFAIRVEDENILFTGRPGLLLRLHLGNLEKEIDVFQQLTRLSMLSKRDRLVFSEKLSADIAATSRVLTWFASMYRAKALQNDQEGIFETYRRLSLIDDFLDDLSNYASSGKLLADRFVLRW